MPANRIFCIGKNYAEHVAELAHLGHSPDGDCVVFMKPASCLVEEGQPIVLPRDRGAVHHEAELVIELTGGGRDIPENEALDCVAGMTLGLDLTLRDLQTALKSNGKPWELAKAFDGSAPMGAVKPYLEQDLQDIRFTCHVNGQLRQQGHTRDMLFPVAGDGGWDLGHAQHQANSPSRGLDSTISSPGTSGPMPLGVPVYSRSPGSSAQVCERM